ncbi:hypothetical protein ABEW05_004484 [Botrytis cinerea]
MGLRPYINLAVEPAPAAPVLAPGLPAGPRPAIWPKTSNKDTPKNYVQGEYDLLPGGVDFVGSRAWLLNSHPGAREKGTPWFLTISKKGFNDLFINKGDAGIVEDDVEGEGLWRLRRPLDPPKPKSKKGKKGPRPRQDCDGVNPPGDSDNQPAAKKRKGVRFPPIFMVLFGI